MRKTVFLFPGQGAQFPQMGCDFYRENPKVRQLFELAAEIFQLNLYKILQDGDDELLRQTAITQAAVTLVNLSAMAVLTDRGIQPHGAAGFSLGEYSALHCCGILSLEDTFRAVKARCTYMEEACKSLHDSGKKPGMAAVLGLDRATIEQTISQLTDVYPANLNAANQTVIAGIEPALTTAINLLEQQGAMKVVRLNVSGPFHTPLLAAAEDRLKEFLQTIEFKSPKINFYSGVSGTRVEEVAEIRRLNEKQIVAQVEWLRLEENIFADNYQNFYEVGPGEVLTRLWKSYNRKVKVVPAGTLQAVQKLEKEIA